MQTDSLFYQIFSASPALLFELIGNPFPRASTYGFASQEVKQTSFRIDGILAPPPYASDLPLYFVEVMGYKDKKGDLYPGFFSEIFLYLNDYRPVNDWRAILIFTDRRFDPGLPTHYQEFAHARLQRIYLDELPENLANRSLELGIVQLIGMNKKAAPEKAKQLIERVRQELTDVANQRKLLELVTTVFIYKFSDLSRQEIEAMLGLSELKQTRVYQEALAEGGRQRELTLVQRLLNRRLGVIEPKFLSQIQTLSSPQLEALAEAILEFSSIQDLVRWLKSLSEVD